MSQRMEMRMTVPAFNEFTLTRAWARKSVWTQHSSWLERTEETAPQESGLGKRRRRDWEGTEVGRTRPVCLAWGYSWVVCKANFLISKNKRFFTVVGKAGGRGRESPRALCREPNWSQARDDHACRDDGWQESLKHWELDLPTQCYMQAFPIEQASLPDMPKP